MADQLFTHAGLEDQHAEAVRDDVVQFAGDAPALGLGGRLGPLGLGLSGLAGLLLRGDHPLVPQPGGRPG